jgi:hypothetical protein
MIEILSDYKFALNTSRKMFKNEENYNFEDGFASYARLR